ncbi:hypothetical protein DNTS_014579 [Danionella cerebrum]|uniref:Uncharacterized protein n=1 Tax=Danionella cerebrum TaxID=2873325 RepID=A0A553Q787_9TELE|nr:hypothetical protein DNTS_014579 [Danionella translucida]
MGFAEGEAFKLVLGETKSRSGAYRRMLEESSHRKHQQTTDRGNIQHSTKALSPDLPLAFFSFKTLPGPLLLKGLDSQIYSATLRPLLCFGEVGQSFVLSSLLWKSSSWLCCERLILSNAGCWKAMKRCEGTGEDQRRGERRHCVCTAAPHSSLLVIMEAPWRMETGQSSLVTNHLNSSHKDDCLMREFGERSKKK